jgi:demethylmenaquinone methyltransferase/2-methoxy-6-polyprenyl-1,4-benzoquinol methylase
MSADEQRYVLAAAQKILRPGGRLVVADEVRPRRWWQRLLYACLRWPMAVVTYALTQTTTAAVVDLAGVVRKAGFELLDDRWWAMGSMGLVVGQKSPPRDSIHASEG